MSSEGSARGGGRPQRPSGQGGTGGQGQRGRRQGSGSGGAAGQAGRAVPSKGDRSKGSAAGRRERSERPGQGVSEQARRGSNKAQVDRSGVQKPAGGHLRAEGPRADKLRSAASGGGPNRPASEAGRPAGRETGAAARKGGRAASRRGEGGTEHPRPSRVGATRRAGARPEREANQADRREEELAIPADFSEENVPVPVRAELRGLPHDRAVTVMGHLMAAGELVDDDPQLALRHALAARSRAARFAVVREVTAETAYAAADFPTALSEFRALRRMTGEDDYLPVIADCERALGKRDQALRTIAQAKQSKLSADQQVELVLVEAGVRDELSQRAESARLLRDAISTNIGPRQGQARLRYAYGALLEAEHDVKGAREWFTSAATYDDGEMLDTQERLAALDATEAEQASRRPDQGTS